MVLTEFDRDRLRTLAEFFRSFSGPGGFELDNSLRPGALGKVSHELVFAPRMNLKTALGRIPEFVEWKRAWKDREDEMISRLTQNLEALATHASDPRRSKQLPEREQRIVKLVLEDLIAHTEPTVTR